MRLGGGREGGRGREKGELKYDKQVYNIFDKIFVVFFSYYGEHFLRVSKVFSE